MFATGPREGALRVRERLHFCLVVSIAWAVAMLSTTLMRTLSSSPHLGSSRQIPASPSATDKVFYAVLAGETTFERRVAAAARSWMSDLPRNRVTVYTNSDNLTHAMERAASDVPVSKARPAYADSEANVQNFGSWSHIVRLRDAWDQHARDPSSGIDWVMLVDDDSYVFRESLEQALVSPRSLLSGLLPHEPGWGGMLECMRVYCGGDIFFARMLRTYHAKSHGEDVCRLPGEEMHMKHTTETIRGSPREVLQSPPLCEQTFCMACPGIPQGGAIVLTRRLVQIIRPYLDECEQATLGMCSSCGSQRLYFCIHFVASREGSLKGLRTVNLPGFAKEPWHLAKADFKIVEKGSPVSVMHGFEHHNGAYLATGTMAEDFALLRTLQLRTRRPNWQDIASAIECGGRAASRVLEKVSGPYAGNVRWEARFKCNME